MASNLLSDTEPDSGGQHGLFGNFEDDLFTTISATLEEIAHNFSKESASLLEITSIEIEKLLSQGINEVKDRCYIQISDARKDVNVLSNDSSVEFDPKISSIFDNLKIKLSQELISVMDKRMSQSRQSLHKHKRKILEKLIMVRHYAAEERRVYDIVSRNREQESYRLLKNDLLQNHELQLNSINNERQQIIKEQAEILAADMTRCYKDEVTSLQNTIRELEDKLRGDPAYRKKRILSSNSKVIASNLSGTRNGPPSSSSKSFRRRSVEKAYDIFSPEKTVTSPSSDMAGERSFSRGGENSLSPHQDMMCLNCAVLEARLQMLTSSHVSISTFA